MVRQKKGYTDCHLPQTANIIAPVLSTNFLFLPVPPTLFIELCSLMQASDDFRKRSLFLSGPTASGKSAISLEVAKLIDVEVISMDSMAIYRGMDIGTAKPRQEAQEQVAHHLIDIAFPNEEFSISQYIELAEKKVGEILKKNRRPLFVGGTPFYLKSLLRGIDTGPPADWEFRKAIEQELALVGKEALYRRLQGVDPLAASNIHPNDVRRIIRALEVHKTTGQPLSHSQTHFEEELDKKECNLFVLQWPRPLLHRRIEERVDKMLERGLLDECKKLLEKYTSLSRTAAQSLGYREAIAHFQGEFGFQEMRNKIISRTRQFARRQETWFRNMPECQFLPAANEAPEEIATKLVARIQSLE